MTTALAKVDQSAIATIGEAWPQSRKEFIRKNFCGNAPDHIAESFLALCERRGLSPEERHIYLVPRTTNKKIDGQWQDVEEYVPQTGIDGYRLIADRTGAYAGSDAPEFRGEGTMSVKQKVWDDEKKAMVWATVNRKHPEMATVTVYKVVKGVRCPFTGIATWEEFNAGTSTWKKMPYVMLAKVAEAQALRKAFPADLSGLYTNEEMEQAGPPATEATFREVPREMPQITPTTTESDEPDVIEESWDLRLSNAQDERDKAKQKAAFRTLLSEVVAEEDEKKARQLVSALPTYAEAENTMTYLFEKHAFPVGEMNKALKARDDAPEFVDVSTGEIVDD